MRRALAWIAGAVGLAAFYRWLTWERRALPEPGPPPADGPADELRRRLVESRAVVAEREDFESAETPVDRADPGPGVEERRQQLHEEGRSVVEEMRGAPTEE